MVCGVLCSLEFSIGPIILYVMFWVINLATLSWYLLQQDKLDLYHSSASNPEENVLQPMPNTNRDDSRMSYNPEVEVQLACGEDSPGHKAKDEFWTVEEVDLGTDAVDWEKLTDAKRHSMLTSFESQDDEGPSASLFDVLATKTVLEEAPEANVRYSGSFIDNLCPCFREECLEHRGNADLTPFESQDEGGSSASLVDDTTTTAILEEAPEANNACPPMLGGNVEEYLRTGLNLGFHNRDKLIAGTSSNGGDFEIVSVFGQGLLNANQTVSKLGMEPIDMHKQL